MATQTMVELADVRKLDAHIEYRTMSDLLADFRRYLEHESETPIERLEAPAAMFLNDLCQFLNLGEKPTAKVLGWRAASFIKTELDAQVKLTAH